MWTSDAAPIACLFQNKVTFLLKIVIFHDEPMLKGKPTLSDDLLVPQLGGCLRYIEVQL